MQIGLNLRGDLAKIEDQELEARLAQLFDEREALSATVTNLTTVGNKWLYDKGLGMPFGRGPIRARLAYQIAATLYGGSHQSGLGRLHMIDCEVKDLLDEAKRRLRNRAATDVP
ncbi:hypothetical protein [Methylobacterium sp. R2-1]|uniref:hypothetical protein n=1 Tax=Methylobacterium sp. R2-1 TaxID=2587064 RepID=UPI00161EF684|nr:hypothetical protein [Methylobacterium sp. R2-1]MBB2964321.1 ornithine carbamoyltransferase [Methylobacterium sp. R2-1]